MCYNNIKELLLPSLTYTYGFDYPGLGLADILFIFNFANSAKSL